MRLDAAFAFRYDRWNGIARLMVEIASPLVHQQCQILHHAVADSVESEVVVTGRVGTPVRLTFASFHRGKDDGEELCGGYGFVVYPGGEDGGGELGERFGADGAAQGEVGPRVAGGDEPEVSLAWLRLDVEREAELAACQSHGLPEQGAANHGV